MYVHDTADERYTKRLRNLETTWWKTLLDVQAPYRWNLRRLRLGFVLDIGCGIGRNLRNLAGHGVGIDHNVESVQEARTRGFNAYTWSEFRESRYAVKGRFDSLLLAHLVEHLGDSDAESVLRDALPFLKPNGKVVIITPQEVGFRSDPTHVAWSGFERVTQLCRTVGIEVVRTFSFPFPRAVGKLFCYNEFVVVGRVATAPSAPTVAFHTK